MKSYLAKIIAFLVAYFTPIVPAIITCGLLVAVDTVTGVMAAYVKKEPIKSCVFFRIAPKLVVYNLLIITGFTVQNHMGISWVPFTDISTGIIAMIEFTSILENVSKVIGKDVFVYLRDILNRHNKK